MKIDDFKMHVFLDFCSQIIYPLNIIGISELIQVNRHTRTHILVVKGVFKTEYYVVMAQINDGHGKKTDGQCHSIMQYLTIPGNRST